MFFDSWSGLLRVFVVSLMAYAALILFLRISGKRTLTKLNAFDLVVTVALGSTLASIVLNKSVAFLEGVLALILLISLQYLITWLSVRSKVFQGLIKAEPTLLLNRGQFVDSALRAQRVTTDDVLAAIRAKGAGDVKKVAAVVLETDGSISVIQQLPSEDSSLSNIDRPSEYQSTIGSA